VSAPLFLEKVHAGNSGPPQNPYQEISADPNLTGLASPDVSPAVSPPGIAEHQREPHYPLDNIVSIFPGAVLREPPS